MKRNYYATSSSFWALSGIIRFISNSDTAAKRKATMAIGKEDTIKLYNSYGVHIYTRINGKWIKIVKVSKLEG